MNSCQFGTLAKMECSIWEFQSHIYLINYAYA